MHNGDINQDTMKMKNIQYISCFRTIILHIKSSRIPVMENDVKITYQVMGRQQITQTIIHVNLKRKTYSSSY